MTRMLIRRELLLLVAVGAFAAAALLGLLAVDVERWRSSLATDDVRYRVDARDVLWQPPTVVPLDAGRRLLGIEDDVAFRLALVTLRKAELDDPTVSEPLLAVWRTEAAQRLESIVVREPAPGRRSRAANLLGVLNMVAFSSSPSGGDFQDRSELLLNAIASFEQAIALDPGNDDAKYNLQVILLRGQGLLPTEAAAGRNPAPGGRGARGAGAGEPGSGY
jgi:hypothetical protein